MRAFRFRLERLERLRSQQERAARLALAERVGIEREIAAACERLRGDLAACADGDERAAPLAMALESGLQRGLARAEHQRKVAESAVQAARRAWEGARREVRTLERLKDRQYRQWKVEARRAEARDMDEVARMRFVARTKRRLARPQLGAESR